MQIILQLAFGLQLCGAVTVRSPPDGDGDGDVPADWYRIAADDQLESGILSGHLARIRATPLEKPSSVSDANDQLHRALKTAWHIGHRFGHTWNSGRQPLKTITPAKARRMAPASGMTRSVNPMDFGADPTGKSDSTEAMKRAMRALLNTTGLAERFSVNGVRDLGGVALDLNGGEYLISEPLVFPVYVGHTGIRGGTLRASRKFPADQWLVIIGTSSKNGCRSDGCNEFITLENMLLDAAHVAAGCTRIGHAFGASVGPAVFCTGFHGTGVQIDSGHEVIVQHAWFAEYYWTEVTKKEMTNSHSIGVQVNGPDHVLQDVIVFNYAHVGVEINGPANLLQNVHAWNGGGIGIQINGALARLVGCYLDWNKLLVLDPEELVVENTLFLDTNIELRSQRQTLINGLRLHGNSYATNSYWVKKHPPQVEMDPKFVGGSADISNECSRQGLIPLKQTRARNHKGVKDATRVEFDFSEVLLLPQIEDVEYTFVGIEGTGFVTHTARKPVGRKVVIETDREVTGNVTVVVSQGTGVYFPGNL